jgi:hypothetical protein
VLGLLGAGSAWGYDSNDDRDLFKQRESEAYTARGIRLNAFKLSPVFDIAEEYNSNVFYRDKAIPGAVKYDYVTHYKPGMAINSDWSRHALNLNFDSDLANYATWSKQADYQDLRSGAAGRLDFTRDSVLSGRVGYSQLHVLNQQFSTGPNLYTSFDYNANYRYVFNRVTFKTEFDGVRLDYEESKSGFNMKSYSRSEYLPSIRFGYLIQPEYEAFFKILAKQIVYDPIDVAANANSFALNRNSKGYNALAGLAFDLTELITGDFSVGYISRSYEQTGFKNISGINGFFNLKWRPTGLTTITARISRDISETTQAGLLGFKTDNNSYLDISKSAQQGVSGILSSGLMLGIEHELLRNVLLNLGGGYQMLDYKSNAGQDRSDKMLTGNFGARYLLNRNLSGGVGYSYQNRETNVPYSGYTGHMIMFSLRGQF